MALTPDQKKEFDRFLDGLLVAAIGQDKEAQQQLADLLAESESPAALVMFQKWATAERQREVKADDDARARMARETATRADRDGVLEEIESLLR